MTLGEFAYVLDVDPKWVLNVTAALGGSPRYDVSTARRFVVTRALSQGLDVPIARGYRMAKDILNRHDGSRRPVRVLTQDGTIATTVDVYRLLAALNAGLSRLRTMYAPRRRGRRASAETNPIRRAATYGLDLTLLESNLRRTPAERLRQLDAMMDFQRRAQRRGTRSTSR